MSIVRTGAGIYEIATFPFPLPENYKPILEPEYVFWSFKYPLKTPPLSNSSNHPWEFFLGVFCWISARNIYFNLLKFSYHCWKIPINLTTINLINIFLTKIHHFDLIRLLFILGEKVRRSFQWGKIVWLKTEMATRPWPRKALVIFWVSAVRHSTNLSNQKKSPEEK